MTGPHNIISGKPERALQLHEKGIDNDAIAARLGIDRSRVSNVLSLARKARVKAKEAAE